MHLDVLDLRNFYYRTGLGRAARRVIREQIAEIWPNTDGESIAGFGFATPLLRPYLGKARRVICLMPGPQGVMPWPDTSSNVSVLCEETLWPLQTGQLDRLIMLHGLETSERPARLLDEAFRVLAPNGRILFVVPNRSGIWARRDKTPFGYGRPYSLGQLETQLRRHGFTPEKHKGALFQLPSERKFWLKTGRVIEKIGQALSSGYAGGVLLVEATKEPFIRPTGLTSPARSKMRILEGIASGEVKPARATRDSQP